MYTVTAFYQFLPVQDLKTTEEFFYSLAKSNDMNGLVIIAPEGFNATVAAPSVEKLNHFKENLLKHFGLTSLNFKDSVAEFAPFRRFQVKVRDEIVTLNTPHLVPDRAQKNHHLSPTEWNQVLKSGEKFKMIDTRNWYETKIGTFKGAVNPGIDVFTEFPKFISQQKIEKDEKLLIFCTGGIRCEKGILQLQEAGYNQVFQLDGGIINYLKEYPNDQFEGECFVFDHRVALDQNLTPTKTYDLCPHCGQPGKETVTCKRCDTPQVVCEDCLKLEWKKDTCSKHCAHQLELHPTRKGKKQVHPWRDTRQV